VRIDGSTARIGAKDSRIDVAPPGDRRRVSEHFRDVTHRLVYRTSTTAVCALRAVPREALRSGNCAAKGAKIFRGKETARAIAHVAVELVCAERTPLGSLFETQQVSARATSQQASNDSG
jgi:hypothetical protein